MPQSPQDLPPQAQRMIGELQQQQQKLQQLGEQKNQFKAEKIQIEKALDALEETDKNEEVFKVVGPVVVKSERDDLIEELKDKKETMEVKMESMEKKEKDIQEKARDNQQKLQKMMSGGEQAGEAG